MTGIKQDIADTIALQLRDDPLSPGEINYTLAMHIASVLVAELGLTEEWSDDVAGPNWARYRRYVTRSEKFKGPAQA